MKDAAKLLCSAASLLYPFRVARVSRLIRKTNTTAKHTGWQVDFGGIGGTDSRISTRNPPKCTKRHSLRSGVLLSCSGHWPPKFLVHGVSHHRTSFRLPPAGSSLLRAAR